jgi:hypothetical protein
MRPLDDRQAAGASVAARRRARVAEQREADAAVAHVARELVHADELAALAVGEDEDGPALGGDELAGLGGRADRQPRFGVRGAQVRGERVHPRLRKRAGAVGVLGGVGDCRDRRGGGDGEHHREDRCAQRGPASGRERDARAEAGGHGGVDAREVAGPQVRHGAGQRETGDEPEPQRRQSAPAHAVQPAMSADGEGRGQGGERGNRLDADPRQQVRLGGEQAQRPGCGGPPLDGGRVLAGAARKSGRLGRARRRPPANVHRVGPQPDILDVRVTGQAVDAVVDQRGVPG